MGDLEKRRLHFQNRIDMTGAMFRAGVGILAGTDTPALFNYPGFSLHEELQLLVRSGLTPLQALQVATLNAARFLGKEAEFGTVQTGKVADLVLLDANPLENISNTQRIHAVVLNGKLLPAEALHKLLRDAETAARNYKPHL